MASSTHPNSDHLLIQQLFNEELSPRFAPTTVHRAYSVLRQALDYAVDPGLYIESNPASKLRLPKLKPLSPSIALTIDELIGVLRLARGHRYGPVIFFAALTGARLGECLGIQNCAVSFHDLRSTLLTQLGDLGVDETTRGRIAGHGPRNVTQRYDRSTAERMRVALTAFEELVFKGLEREEAS